MHDRPLDGHSPKRLPGLATVLLVALFSGCGNGPEVETDGGADPWCGDGVVDPGEACDDGTTAADGDGCSSECSVEDGYQCTGEPSVCFHVLPPECLGDPATAEVSETCAVFVRADAAEEGDGTRASPFKSLQVAIEAAQGKRIYACDTGTFYEALHISEPVTLYGGFACSGEWTWSEAATTLVEEPTGTIPLRVEAGASSSFLGNLVIRAAQATEVGASSIAGLVDGAAIELSNVTLMARQGAGGKIGYNWGFAATAGMPGLDGGDACSSSFVQGGLPSMMSCDGVDTIGGNGGTGYSVTGATGGDGLPFLSNNAGPGATQETLWCEVGDYGETGIAGTPGAGGTGLGEIGPEGYRGADGADGGRGGPGQGGGGGGGALGGTGAGKCPDGASAGGAAGGSGGTGGCGGEGGRGGGAGGSSIALISLNASLTFHDVVLASDAGGAGGAGSEGQTGGSGGAGGDGGAVPDGAANLNPACDGGGGGFGGEGGPGGGGQGGHSLSIAFTGTAPPASGWTSVVGAAGAGGGTTAGGESGAAGVSAMTQAFD